MNQVQIEHEEWMYRHKKRMHKTYRSFFWVHVAFLVVEISGYATFILREILPKDFVTIGTVGVGAMFVHAMLYNLQEIRRIRKEMQDNE